MGMVQKLHPYWLPYKSKLNPEFPPEYPGFGVEEKPSC